MQQRSSSRARRISAGTGTIALSLGLTLGAGLLVAPQAAAAATPVVTAAAAASVRTLLLNSVDRPTIAWGSKVRVTTKLRDAKTGKAITAGTVKLQAWRDGAWRTWVTRKVGAGGKTVFYTTPLISGYLRAYYNGSGRYAKVAGKSLMVKVAASGQKVLSQARKHTGALYLYGASGPKRFDCSGFTMYVYKKAAGRKLPHKANSQQKYGKSVAKGSKRIGDLIVFRSGSYGYHAAIYAGNGYVYDSPHSGARVGRHKMFSSNYVVRRLAAV